MTLTTTDRLILHSMATTPMSERIKIALTKLKKNMTTLQQIKSNPKTNQWGTLGSRNRIPIAVNVTFDKGVIFAINNNQAIYKAHSGFNEGIELDQLTEDTLLKLNCQIA